MKQNTFCRLLLMAALLFCTLSSYAQSDAVNSYGLVDDLTYSYNGNQLTKGTDAVTSSSYTGGTNFIDGANVENEYAYDANGNLTKDLNKGIANITYNSLNLPSVVTFSDGNTITYTYAYDGTKLRTVYVIDGETTTTDYCGNVIYENGTAKRLLHDEGFVDLTTNTYYYYLKDHQGNNRVVIDGSGNVVETNDYYPFGGLFATNSDVQPYKYNGKELDTKKGLNLYDYGARHYDAALGRFTTIDPLAEKIGAWSPYGYCKNSPLMFIDPNGKREWPVNETYKNGVRRHSNDYGSIRKGRKTAHKGVDINIGSGDNDKGAPVYATHDGIVTRIVTIGNGDMDAGGNRIQITSEDGLVSTYYMHLDEVDASLEVGTKVNESQQIGTIGGSGGGISNQYTPHLHYELMINGGLVNPAQDGSSLKDPQNYLNPIDKGILPEIEIIGDRPQPEKLYGGSIIDIINSLIK